MPAVNLYYHRQIMAAHILVAYTTRKGSTAEIALAIAKELENTGAAVTVSDMATVSSLDGYNAVVIGAPVYTGKGCPRCCHLRPAPPGQSQEDSCCRIRDRHCSRVPEDR